VSFQVGDAVNDGREAEARVVEVDDGNGDFWYCLEYLDGSREWWNQVGVSPATLHNGDPVQSPSHYDLPGGMQVIDMIRGESFLRGNIIKYVMRAPHKGNELQDMKKAAEYLKWEIERLENEQPS